MRGCLVVGAIILVFVVFVCSECGESETTTTAAPAATTRPTTTTAAPTTTSGSHVSEGLAAVEFSIESSTSVLHGGLKFTVLGIEKFGQMMRLNGYEYTAKSSWLVVTLRVENVTEEVLTYKSKDQTLFSEGVTYRAESNMVGVNDSLWVGDSSIESIPLFFDVPEAFPEDKALVLLNLVENDSDTPPGVVQVRVTRRATETTPATDTTTTTEVMTEAVTTVATKLTTTTRATVEETTVLESRDREFLELLRYRAPRYDSEYLFRVYSDEELVFLGRDFCDDLTDGVPLEALYGDPNSVAAYVTGADDVSVVSEGGLGVEYLTAIDTWCPEHRPMFDTFVGDIRGIVEGRSATTTDVPTDNEALDIAVLIHPVLGSYELADLYEVAEAVCDQFEQGADWDTVTLALYLTSPEDWDEETVGYFVAYAIRRHCPNYEAML